MSPAASTSKSMEGAKPSLTASVDSPADSGENDAAESRFTEFCKVHYKHGPTLLLSILLNNLILMALSTCILMTGCIIIGWDYILAVHEAVQRNQTSHAE